MMVVVDVAIHYGCQWREDWNSTMSHHSCPGTITAVLFEVEVVVARGRAVCCGWPDGLERSSSACSAAVLDLLSASQL